MAVLEQWVLDGLALNDATFLLESISDPPPQKNAEWIAGSDSDGAILGRIPRYPNRVIEMQIRVAQQATMDLAVAKVALVLDKLQECEQHTNGLPLAWTIADSALAALTGRALMGQIKDLPKDWQGSNYFLRNPIITIELTCLPFFHGVEYLGGTNASNPMAEVTLTGVPGDVPALGRVVVTDTATGGISRRWSTWGAESRYLSTSSPADLFLDAPADLVTTGFVGVSATKTGAWGAGSNSIGATLRTQVQAICGLGNQTHVGAYRPQLRYWTSADTIALRLVYKTLDGPFRNLSYRVPVTTGWNHVDLGEVFIPQTTLGAQRWTGRIEAYSTATGGETINVDYVAMMPAESFGRARATYLYTPGLISAFDDFTTTTAGAALHARTLPVGAGTWQTSGVATDFAFADGPATGNETIMRSTAVVEATPREAEMGTGTFTNLEFSFDLLRSAMPAGSGNDCGCYVRYVDASNYLRAGLNWSNTLEQVIVHKRIAGTQTVLKYVNMIGTFQVNTWYRFRVVIFASGNGVLTITNVASGAVAASFPFFTAELATGGALASGKNRIFDRQTHATAITRYYDNVYGAIATDEPVVCYATQSLEYRYDSTLREDSTGTYAGAPPEYVGGRPFISPAGTANRQTRVATMTKRNDVGTMPDDYLTDDTQTQVYVTPRYLAVPRP